VLYMANPSSGKVRDAMTAGLIGYIDTPAQGNRRFEGVTWCADNGCFGKGYPGDEKWLAWLEKHSVDAATCLFAVAPDVVGDAAATLERSVPFLPIIREMGYPAALVAQDGLENLGVPWDDFDVLFIGGTTEWKLGSAAARLIREAKTRGKHVHVGRVNSARRFAHFELLGADSCDGTYIVFGPNVNLPKVLHWGQSLLSLLDKDAS
jgi:hypothetical protein